MVVDEAGSWKLRCEAEENGSLPQNEARSWEDASLLRVRSDGNASGRSWRVGCCKSMVTLSCCVVSLDMILMLQELLSGDWVISPGAALPAAR
jgi:hypothetical protein